MLLVLLAAPTTSPENPRASRPRPASAVLLISKNYQLRWTGIICQPTYLHLTWTALFLWDKEMKQRNYREVLVAPTASSTLRGGSLSRPTRTVGSALGLRNDPYAHRLDHNSPVCHANWATHVVISPDFRLSAGKAKSVPCLLKYAHEVQLAQSRCSCEILDANTKALFLDGRVDK